MDDVLSQQVEIDVFDGVHHHLLDFLSFFDAVILRDIEEYQSVVLSDGIEVERRVVIRPFLFLVCSQHIVDEIIFVSEITERMNVILVIMNMQHFDAK